MPYAESVVQVPYRSGSPQGVRAEVPPTAFGAAPALEPVAGLCPAAGRAINDTTAIRLVNTHAVMTHCLLM